jgi:glucosyl-3-phosphoglycerate synthase
MSARARSWHHSHTFHHAEFPPERLATERRATVSVCLPARDEERTIGPILKALVPLRELGAIDQIVVVDDSRDATARIARELGAEVHDQEQLLPALGPVLGKGDAMWR